MGSEPAVAAAVAPVPHPAAVAMTVAVARGRHADVESDRRGGIHRLTVLEVRAERSDGHRVYHSRRVQAPTGLAERRLAREEHTCWS